MSSATKSRTPKPSGARRPLPVQTSTPANGKPADPGRYDPALEISRIVTSRTNPRKTFDDVKLEELASSIRAKGVLQPILVRPRKGREHIYSIAPINDAAKLYSVFPPDEGPGEYATYKIVGKEAAKALAEALGHDHFELVAGERRLRACKLAGLTTIPATIRVMSDADALEVQVIENLQREDLDPVEEAEGFQQLIKLQRYTAETLAAKLTKSKGYVYGALKLLQAPATVLDAVRAGDVPLSVAQLVGRIPNAKLREEAAAEVLGNQYEGPLSFRQAKDVIEDGYMKELKGAPFDIKCADLTPAGPCMTCPARTGNARELYPDGRADICTDPACFRDKVRAHGERAAAKLQAHGVALLPDGEKLFYEGSGQLRNDKGFVELQEDCWQAKGSGGSDPKSWGQLLGKDADGIKSAAVDASGQVHVLVPRKMAEQILLDKGVIEKPSRHSGIRDETERFDQQVKAETGKRLMALAAEAARSQAVSAVGVNGPKFLRPLVALLFDEFWSEVVTKTLARRKHDGRIETLIETLDDYGLLGLLAELAVCKRRMTSFYRTEGDDKPLLAALGIDAAAVTKQVRDELKTRKAKPGKGK